MTEIGAMMAKRWAGVGLLCLAASGAPAKDQAPPPAEVQEFARCRAVADDAARLRCFDAAADRLQAALTTHKVYVLDREDVRKTRKSLFGLSLPQAAAVSDAVDDENKVDRLDAIVTGATQIGDGTWRVTLDSGSTWQQVDDYQLGRGIKRGDKVEVRRAALGSYKMKVGTQPAVRVRRVF